MSLLSNKDRCRMDPHLKTIVVVDDEDGIRQSFKFILSDSFNIFTFSSAEEAYEFIAENNTLIDVIFSDLRMCRIGGIELLRQVKQQWDHIEVIIVTAYPNTETTMAALKIGAFDYILKPFDAKHILDTAKRAIDKKEKNRSKAKLMSDLKRIIEKNYKDTTTALIKTIDAKDSYTYGHSHRVADLFQTLGLEMGIDHTQLEVFTQVASLHDIGKIGVSEQILLKNSPLSDEEFEEMKRHVLIGYDILKPVEYLQEGLDAMLCHQERFDGRGYPYKMKGTDIPLAGRIIAVADAYDAMTSDRPYRNRLTLSQTIRELETNAGKQFDPEIVKVFIRLLLRKIVA